VAVLTSRRMSDAPGALASPLRISLRVFALLTLIYLCTWAGHYTSGDGSYKVAWAKAMLGQAPGISPGPNGVYSKWGIGHSLLAMPPLAVAYAIRRLTGIRTESVWYTLMFVINGALFLALVAYYLAHFYPSSAVWATVLIMGLATIWWPYTKLDFSEPLVLTTAFLGFVLMRFGNPVLGMMVAGFALTIRTDAVVIVGPMILWYWLANPSIRAAMKVALSLAPSIALFVFANYIRYHSLMDQRVADERFSNPLLVGLYGLLLSSGKSIFLFSPPLLLGVWGWRQFAHRKETVSDAWLFLGIFSAQILFYAKYWAWSADDAWGPRYILPGALFLCIPMVAVLNRRAIVIPVVVAGVLVQLLAVTVGGLDFVMLVRSSHPQREAMWVGGSNRIDFEDVWFNPNYSQIAGSWILLRYLLHIPPKPGRPEDAPMIGTALYDAIPSQNWKAAARWDFIWKLPRSARPGDAKTAPPITSAPVQ
jgi:hypothetical protein